jgi:hypothetical protein
MGMLGLAVAGIAGAYALNVQNSVKLTMACSNATGGATYNASNNGCAQQRVLSLEGQAVDNSMQGVANVTAEFDLVGTIVVATVILGLIFGLFQFVRN